MRTGELTGLNVRVLSQTVEMWGAKKRFGSLQIKLGVDYDMTIPGLLMVCRILDPERGATIATATIPNSIEYEDYFELIKMIGWRCKSLLATSIAGFCRRRDKNRKR